MRLRERFPFDYPVGCGGAVHVNILAATPDRRTWWCEAGANGGIRVLAHFAQDGEVYVSERLHAEVLVKDGGNSGVQGLLRYAADRLGVTDMVVPEQRPYAEWRYGMASWSLSIPGFHPWEQEPSCRVADPPNGRINHTDGWYTRTERALPLPAPTWAPDARAWDIREGVYVVFADESYRLIRRREYYDFLRIFDRPPIARQGDLLVFDEPPAAIRRVGDTPLAMQFNGGTTFRCVLGDDSGDGKEESLDRHTFRPAGLPDAGEFGCVLHPEHDRLDLPGTWETLILAPGTSRPFQGTGVVD